MSNCFKELFDYDLAKKCSKCGIISLKSNFHENQNRKHGVNSMCKVCMKDYYLKKNDKIIPKTKDWNKNNPEEVEQNQKKYNEQNKEKRNVYPKNKRENNVIFRLIRNTGNIFYEALKCLTKLSSTKDILGIDINLYRKWIEWQMTPEMNWTNLEIDHVNVVSLFDVSKEEELIEAFSSKNTQALLKHDHHLEGTKVNFLNYQLQFRKAYQFLKLNEENRLNENIH